MNNNFGYVLYNKINFALNKSKTSKKKIAESLGISQTALSNQFKKLKETNSIDIVTVKCIEDLTKVNFFNLSYTETSTE